MKSVICGVQYFGILLIYNVGWYSPCWAPNGSHQSFWIGETALIAVHRLPVPQVNFYKYIKTLNSVPYSCDYKVERAQRALPLAAKHNWPREAYEGFTYSLLTLTAASASISLIRNYSSDQNLRYTGVSLILSQPLFSPGNTFFCLLIPAETLTKHPELRWRIITEHYTDQVCTQQHLHEKVFLIHPEQ